MAGPDATLSGVLQLENGAPPVHIEGFDVTGSIQVGAAAAPDGEALKPVTVSRCKFRRPAPSGRRLDGREEAGGAALTVRNGHITVSDSEFEGLSLAVHVQGGELIVENGAFDRNKCSMNVTGGSVRVYNTVFNTPPQAKNALEVIGGTVVLTNETLLLGKQGAVLLRKSQGAKARYELPAPLGRYAFIPDTSGVYDFPDGESLGQPGFPYPCSAGIVGDSFDPVKQSNPACAHQCPPGHWCGQNTVVPTQCQKGTYCPRGSPAELLCPAGTMGNQTELESEEECVSCPKGTSCPRGSEKEQACSAGTYADTARSASCTQCEAGKYQDEIRQDSCKICGKGHVCPAGSASQTPCLQGTWSGDEGRSEHSQCNDCPLGMYCPEGSTAPEKCPAGTKGTATKLGDDLSCTPCADNTWSAPGSTSCTSCRPGYYLRPQEKENAPIECMDCASPSAWTAGRVPQVNCSRNAFEGVTLEAIDLAEGWWRLGSRSMDLYECDESDSGDTPCRGGNQPGVGGSGYCQEGHTVCVQRLAHAPPSPPPALTPTPASLPRPRSPMSPCLPCVRVRCASSARTRKAGSTLRASNARTVLRQPTLSVRCLPNPLLHPTACRAAHPLTVPPLVQACSSV